MNCCRDASKSMSAMPPSVTKRRSSTIVFLPSALSNAILVPDGSSTLPPAWSMIAWNSHVSGHVPTS
jgi:hypothetical protein